MLYYMLEVIHKAEKKQREKKTKKSFGSIKSIYIFAFINLIKTK